MDLGYKLLKYRKLNKYSQKEVADLLNVSQSTYCDWESETSSPKIENIIKIAELYGISINELLSSSEASNVVNSPNTINNSPNSKIETSDALFQVAESLNKLIVLVEKLIQK